MQFNFKNITDAKVLKNEKLKCKKTYNVPSLTTFKQSHKIINVI